MDKPNFLGSPVPNIILFPVAIASCLALWTVWIAIYRLYLSPVAKVPGPRLAALTFWYEFYYDVIKVGQYTWKIKALHEEYGPIIRINPYEVHVADPEFYDQVYVGPVTRKTDKWWWSADMFSIPESIIATIPHDLHRRRRALLSNHFSIASIRRLEPVVRSKIDKLVDRLDQAAATKEPISLTNAYSALTIDIVTAYAFAKSRNYLDSPDFSPAFVKLVLSLGPLTHVTKQMPWLIPAVKYLPSFISSRIFPRQAATIEMQNFFIEQIHQARQNRMNRGEKGEDYKVTGNVDSLFDSWLDAKAPESEKRDERLAREAQLVVVAGTLTTAHALETISFHLINNPHIIAQLKDALAVTEAAYRAKEGTDGGAMPLHVYESCEYLTAIVREGLRMSYGVPHRLQRVSPDTSLYYDGYELPPRTPVSMSALLIHENEDYFPDPHTFKPERWLPMDSVGNKLFKYLVSFSKGSRQCAGMNLAWAELFLTVPAVFGGTRTYALHDTVFERDLKTVVDAFSPQPSAESKGLRVVVENKA